MGRIARGLILAAGWLVAFAPRAVAQTAPSLFVSGGVFASIEHESHLESTIAPFPSLDGTVAGGSVAAGAFLTPRVTVRAEFTFRGDLEATDARTATVFAPGAVTYTETRTVTDSIRTGSVLLAYHTRADRAVRFEYMGGLAFVYQRRTATIETNAPLSGGLPPHTRSSTITYGTVAAVGLDVPVRVRSGVDLVPQVRAQSTGGLTIRPGISARVRF